MKKASFLLKRKLQTFKKTGRLTSPPNESQAHTGDFEPQQPPLAKQLPPTELLQSAEESQPMTQSLSIEQLRTTDPSQPVRNSQATEQAQPVESVRQVDLHTSVKESGWSALKRAFQVVRDGSDLFLPLKAALVGVVTIMEEVEVGIAVLCSDT